VPKDTLTFRIEPETREALDALSDALKRDRSYVINEAVHSYIDMHQWQVEHIRQGVREADAGKFVSEADVKRTLNRLRRG
jgi:RHH-type rel operon transcriptional repressor/antitoxin RelB